MIKICKTCGKAIDEIKEVATIVNEGLDSEFAICEDCALNDNDKYHICDACGSWFTGDVIHDEVLSKRITFTPCPSCGKDIVDCMTREEMLREAEPYRFAVIVTYTNGYNRGYMVEADDRVEVMKKLLANIDNVGISNIAISEILVEGDIIR